MRQRTREEALRAIQGIAPKLIVETVEGGNAVTIRDENTGVTTRIPTQSGVTDRSSTDAFR